jgi:hypothetical protein
MRLRQFRGPLGHTARDVMAIKRITISFPEAVAEWIKKAARGAAISTWVTGTATPIQLRLLPGG